MKTPYNFSKNRDCCNLGFSLVEVLAVIVIISIIVLMSIRSPYQSNANLVSEVELLRSHLRYAQSLAMSSNADSWGISITATGYSLYKNGSTAAAKLPGLNSATYIFKSGVLVVQGDSLVLFDEWGSPGNSTVNITLSDGNYSSTISLTAETGYQL